MLSNQIDDTQSESEKIFSRQGLIEVAGAVLARGAQFRFQAHGSSMAPCIRDGDILTLSPISEGLHPGDVVGFVHPVWHRLVVHRVIGRSAGGWLFRGDNVELTDASVDRRHILGRVTRVERSGRVVWLGLGPERAIIAWLSSRGLLQSTLVAMRRMRGPFMRREGHGG